MGDPLTIAASVAGLISLGVQVTQSLIGFYTSYRDHNSDLAAANKKLESLLVTFQQLKETLASRRFEADERSLIEKIENTIGDCNVIITELQDEYEKLTKALPNDAKNVIKAAGRRVTYPFRRSTLLKLDEDVDALRANISFALDVLQVKDNRRIQDDIHDTKSLLDLVRASQVSADIRDWLKAPDASINHNAACAKKHPGTGMWLVKSHAFITWLTEENSFLWLNGFAGSGKSVLCSTAIQFTFRHRRSDPRVGIAFFYFTFNDESKQDESALLRAWLLQLSNQLQDGHRDLTRLYESYRTSTPPSPVLLVYFRHLAQKFDHVYLMLDALDESSRNGLRGRVLNTLEVIRDWNLHGVHIFATSRDELDIRESINPSSNQVVTMQDAGTDKDIADYISSRLTEDRGLRKWLPYRDKIQDTLAKRAQGVYVYRNYRDVILKTAG